MLAAGYTVSVTPIRSSAWRRTLVGEVRADALTAQADAIAVRVARSASNVRKLCTGRGSPCAGSAHLQAALCVQPGTVWRGHGGTALRLEPDRIVTIEQ